ncbi:hypothetical protein J437_LFUL013771 [Ladona fulva]|uniref:Uncharacterized protein n=1 Tax=Ladona fulva TaxID=123851 RepID=A0A8K0KE36_LADFU|nr:hypothetical protein J437_LFUL013771 [Ladona fulva]
MTTLEADFNQVKDLDSTKTQGRLKLEELEKERDNLYHKLKDHKLSIEETASTISECEILKQELEEDAHWIVLKNLERRISQLKQSNMALKDYIEGKRYEQDSSEARAQAIELFGKVQEVLKKNLVSSTMSTTFIQGKIS